jgi:AraC-like DNA-binding protein
LTGLTPNELLQLIRLKKAATYLLKKEYRINEVAYMVGFSNPSYFSKCFQKQFGLKPMEFIQQNLHQEEV